MFRTVERRRGSAACGEGPGFRVAIEDVLEVPPVHLKTIPGFETSVFPFTTDIPFLSAWGVPLLFGPGSIHLAHTADEYVTITELTDAVDHYATLARALVKAAPPA